MRFTFHSLKKKKKKKEIPLIFRMRWYTYKSMLIIYSKQLTWVNMTFTIRKVLNEILKQKQILLTNCFFVKDINSKIRPSMFANIVNLSPAHLTKSLAANNINAMLFCWQVYMANWPEGEEAEGCQILTLWRPDG